MGLLDKLFGIDNMLGDSDIAYDMLKDSKFAVISLAKAITSVTNPTLREFLEDQLFLAIKEHHKLADITMSKNWYKPFMAPESQVQEDFDATITL
ncbi:MAG TPA: spore coat protein [Peptococcaceae bacterium]|nr:spore coat protein [Peptococcaceae bacterium]